MNIHLIIKQLSEQRRITQKEFGEALGVNKQTAHNYLNGNTKIIADDIPIIARLLRVPISSLFESDADLKTLLQEPQVFNKECQSCKDKDETIAALKESNEMLKEKIKYLSNKN